MIYLEDALSFDPNHSDFTEDELKNGINFDTYRKFVNNFTSSASLGFRIEGEFWVGDLEITTMYLYLKILKEYQFIRMNAVRRLMAIIWKRILEKNLKLSK